MKKQKQEVREVVSDRYSIETAFHRHAASVNTSDPTYAWASEILRSYYDFGKGIPFTMSNVGDMGAATNAEGHPFLFVQITSSAGMAECESALRRRLLEQRTATFAVGTNGEEFIFLKRRHDADRVDYAADLPRSFTSPGPDLFSSYGGPADEDAINASFADSHNAIRDIEGMHDDEALDELCKVIYTILHGYGAGASTSSDPRPPLELAASIRGHYEQAALTGRTETSGDAFTAPIRLSDASLIRVWRSLSDSGIKEATGDIKGRAFQSVLAPAMRAGMGQYFTPATVVDFMVNAVKPTLGSRVLDPFCGSAHFLTTVFEMVAESGHHDPLEVAKWGSNALVGIEKSERMVRIARTDQLLSGSVSPSIYRDDALAPFANYATIRANSFDVVLTNPPFGSLLGVDAIESLGSFDLAKRTGTTPVDVLGLERSVQFLRPGGRLGIILPEGVFSNQRLGYVRKWILSTLQPIAIISLPVATFAPFGANVRTVAFFAIKKKFRAEDSASVVLVGGADNVGYDAAGRLTPALNDLGALAAEVADAFGSREVSDVA